MIFQQLLRSVLVFWARFKLLCVAAPVGALGIVLIW